MKSKKILKSIPIEPNLKLNRINDGKTDSVGNLLFGTMDNLERKIGGVFDKDGNISISYNPKQETSRDILKKAEGVGLKVNDFSVTGASLETVFLSMTSKK